MRSALSIFLPGTRRRGQLALPRDEAAESVPVMGAAGGRGGRVCAGHDGSEKPVATTPSITIETAGIVVRPNARGCRVARGCAARGEGPLMIRQIRRPHATLSPSANLCAPRYHAR